MFHGWCIVFPADYPPDGKKFNNSMGDTTMIRLANHALYTYSVSSVGFPALHCKTLNWRHTVLIFDNLPELLCSDVEGRKVLSGSIIMELPGIYIRKLRARIAQFM